ncbi:hypothetical protein T492DRAFT_970127 [Pavlovales sp. CCMP2436]|nr:hypothetical protein T492DRAFT_970127 [Pavlovales sp. CCMP2436]
MHLRHHSHARAWRSLARPTSRPAARAHASSSCSSVSVCTLAHLADRFLRFRAGRQARAMQRVARRRAGGLQPAMRLRPWDSPSICARASRWQGWASFGTYQQTTAEHALLANAAANFGNICGMLVHVLACWHAHTPAGATSDTRRLLRAPSRLRPAAR